MTSQPLPKALSNAMSMPRQDIAELIDAIANPTTRKKLLQSLRALTNSTEGNQIDLAITSAGKSGVESLDSGEGIDTLRNAVFRILKDKELFSTSGELARAIERELGVKVDPENRLHQSRDRIIQRTWNDLIAQKNAIFKSRVAKFLAKFGPTQDDQYQALFDLLSRRE